MDLAIAEGIAIVATAGVVRDRAHRADEITRRQLEGALASRVLIEQAKGCLARDHDETPDAAFIRLRAFARRRRRRMTDVARKVVFEGADLG